MRTFEQLTEDEQLRVKEFIEENVDITVKELRSCGAIVKVENGFFTIQDKPESEFIESEFVDYWCDVCQHYLSDKLLLTMMKDMDRETMDKLLIEHVMKHLKIE